MAKTGGIQRLGGTHVFSRADSIDTQKFTGHTEAYNLLIPVGIYLVFLDTPGADNVQRGKFIPLVENMAMLVYGWKLADDSLQFLDFGADQIFRQTKR